MPPSPAELLTTATAATTAGGENGVSTRLRLLDPAPRSVTQLTPAALPAGDVEALYVHIPFCFHKCHYCDFYSITRQGEDRMGRFVELLLAEADQWRASAVGAGAKPRTIFFG